MSENNNSYKKSQGFLISCKTIFLLYIAFAFSLAYENLIFLDARWGSIYSTAVVFVLPYLVLDYVIAILRFTGTINDKKFGGILIFDLLIDQAPRFPTKKGFVPNWKGFILQAVIGILLFSYFWGVTQSTSAVFAGVPSLTPAQLTPLDSATKAGLVAIPEDALSTTLTSLFAIVITFGFAKFGKKGMGAIIVALLIGAYLSAMYMSDLHTGVYSLDESALDSITKFFFTINAVSAITGANYAADYLHFQWNAHVISSGMCLGSQCS